jgi:hypothetical protein
MQTRRKLINSPPFSFLSFSLLPKSVLHHPRAGFLPLFSVISLFRLCFELQFRNDTVTCIHSSTGAFFQTSNICLWMVLLHKMHSLLLSINVHFWALNSSRSAPFIWMCYQFRGVPSFLLTHSKVQDILWKADSHSSCQTACFLHETRRFIKVLTKIRHWILSLARWIPFFHGSVRAKESVHVRGALKHFVTYYFLRWGVVSPTPKPQVGGPLLVGCPRLLIQYIRSYPPYLEAFSSIRDLRLPHAIVKRDPLNTEGSCAS